MAGLVKNGVVVAHVVPSDREALLARAKAILAALPDVPSTQRQRASWQRQIEALSKPDDRVLIETDAQPGERSEPAVSGI